MSVKEKLNEIINEYKNYTVFQKITRRDSDITEEAYNILTKLNKIKLIELETGKEHYLDNIKDINIYASGINEIYNLKHDGQTSLCGENIKFMTNENNTFYQVSDGIVEIINNNIDLALLLQQLKYPEDVEDIINAEDIFELYKQDEFIRKATNYYKGLTKLIESNLPVIVVYKFKNWEILI